MIGLRGNPYSIDQPAEELFYGRQSQVEKIIASLTAPTAGSFALIGGRRFGKTSLLHSIERHLWAMIPCSPNGTYCVIPIYLNLLSDEITGWDDLFPLVIDTITEQTAEHYPDLIPDDWNTPAPTDTTRPSHRVFADKILKLCRSIAQKGNPVRVLLLMDETEEILDKPWRTILFNRLRWLIYENERTRNHIKIILAGSSSFYNDVRQRSSPLWGVLTFEFMDAFSEEETLRLIQEPCDNQISEIVARQVAQYSGGHPYIIQYLMHHLWQKNLVDILPRRVDELSERFERDHWSHLDGWLKSIGEMGCKAYSVLLSHADWIEEDAIRKEIEGPTPELVPGLAALCYHGWAVHDSDWRYRPIGGLIRNWFTRNMTSDNNYYKGKTMANPQSTKPVIGQPSLSAKGKIDFAIITIREDEFEAVLERFAPEPQYFGDRRYVISRVDLDGNDYYQVAIARCTDQGEGPSQDLARDMIEQLDPEWLLVVGIAGGVPDDDFTLGDVVVAKRLLDFSVKAVSENKPPEYDVRGWAHPLVEQVCAALPAMRKKQEKKWNSPKSIGALRPGVQLDQEDKFYGDDAWKKKVKASLEGHFKETRPPRFTTAVIGATEELVKSPTLVQLWLQDARSMRAVEMELAGVYQAAKRVDHQYPVLAIRGISDIVGFKRDSGWTTYACHSAAAFAFTLVRSGFIKPSIASRTGNSAG